ncbi:hypothetical protein BGZ95_003371 [Linnemannia exigua]|uniref:G domain-containing protein n=1 Tax=Linnemannia exigua TaxID=604196 RepID=A0AAD4DHZ6_9FUNG|nr:hypothetical protein BGZ95_003371 [Linnemannia exigua]
MTINQDPHQDRDWAQYLGRGFHPISNRECLNHCNHQPTAESQTINKVRIRTNYYSSSAEYDKSRNVNVDGGISTPFDIVGLNTKYDKKTQESGRQNTSYFVYHCEVINYSVSEKQAGINSCVSEKHAGVNSSVSEKQAGIHSSVSEIQAGINSSVPEKPAGVNSSVSEKLSGISSSVSETLSGFSSAVSGKLPGIKSKPYCYVNSVTYGGYLRIIVETTNVHADVHRSDFAELDVELTEIHSSMNIFTDFLRTKSDYRRNDAFRYHFSLEHSGQAETSNINADNIGAAVDAFISNVRHNRDKSVKLSHSYSTCPMDPTVIQINKKNYAFLEGIYNRIKSSGSSKTRPILSEIEGLLKKLDNADITNQSQFDYNYTKICDHHPELSSKLINFQFYTYVTKYKKMKEMPIHLLLIKMLDSFRYNPNEADKKHIKDKLKELERLCSRHCDGETDIDFMKRVKKYIDYADEKLKYGNNQIESDSESIMSDHTYVKDNNIENALMDGYDVVRNTFYARHKIIRFLSKDKYVDTAYEFEASDVGKGMLLIVLSPFILLASPLFLWEEVKDIRKRRLYSTKEFLEIANRSYHNNLERCKHLACGVYGEDSEYIEDNIANVSDYSVFSDRAKRYEGARVFFDSVKLIKSLRDLEINRFVIAVIGNTKVGKSSFLARLGLKTNARAGVHTTQITPYMLGGVMFLDFPGNDDVDDVIRNEFLQNYRTVDMCIVVSEINKAATDGVFSLINKLRVANDIPYLVFLNHCDRVIDDDENDEDEGLSIDAFHEIVNEKTDKVTRQFHHNGIKTLKIYPTSFKRNVRNLADYGVISVRDVMFIVKQILDMEKIKYNEAQLFEHIGGCEK